MSLFKNVGIGSEVVIDNWLKNNISKYTYEHQTYYKNSSTQIALFKNDLRCPVFHLPDFVRIRDLELNLYEEDAFRFYSEVMEAGNCGVIKKLFPSKQFINVNQIFGYTEQTIHKAKGEDDKIYIRFRFMYDSTTYDWIGSIIIEKDNNRWDHQKAKLYNVDELGIYEVDAFKKLNLKSY